MIKRLFSRSLFCGWIDLLFSFFFLSQQHSYIQMEYITRYTPPPSKYWDQCKDWCNNTTLIQANYPRPTEVRSKAVNPNIILLYSQHYYQSHISLHIRIILAVEHSYLQNVWTHKSKPDSSVNNGTSFGWTSYMKWKSSCSPTNVSSRSQWGYFTCCSSPFAVTAHTSTAVITVCTPTSLPVCCVQLCMCLSPHPHF